MMRVLLAAWNPSKYTVLREISPARLALLLIATCAISATLFTMLVMPALLRTDAALEALRGTAEITLDGTLVQESPTYLSRNPDVLVTPDDGDGFIVITPDAFRIKFFLFFGERTYPWLPYTSLATFPAAEILGPLLIFVLPSVLLWGTLVLALQIIIGSLLYATISAPILHLRGFAVRWTELAKIAALASVPGLAVFAATPILRLGLPLAIIFGFVFVLWLALTFLGTAALLERRAGQTFTPGKSHARRQ